MSPVFELFNLRACTALVTGGAGLLGAKFVETLALAGATVYALDRSEEGLTRAIATMDQDAQARVSPVSVDITNEDAIEFAVASIAAGAPSLDILVNSAAVDPKFEGTPNPDGPAWGSFTSYPLAAWKASMDVNLTGTFLTTRAVCRHMEKSGSGSIINVSSTYGLVGPDQALYRNEQTGAKQTFFKPVDYSTTKAGLIGFTRALAAFYAGTRIRVNALSPGGTYNNNPDDFVQRYSRKTIAQRMATPSDYSGALLYLSSNASAYMTGANVVVDGGWTAV